MKSFAIIYIVWILFCVLISLPHYNNGYYGFWGVYLTGFPFSFIGNVMENKGSVVNILLVGFSGLIQWLVIIRLYKILKK